MLPPILEEIQRYTRQVEEKKIRCELSCCPLCAEAASFSLHDRRRRSYFVIIERLVRTVLSCLSRWKCRHCGGTFTLYPSFALPRKRYLREDILERTGRYVDEDSESYRGAVKVERMPVFHEGAVGRVGAEPSGREPDPVPEKVETLASETIDERSLSHTTLYRWIALFSALQTTQRKALELVRQKAPSSQIFRKLLPIAPRKYRSEQRRRLLAEARRLLLSEAEYRRLFEDSIFPRLATLCSWS